MEKLGKRAKDKVTGLEGTVVSKHIYLHGSSQYGIQPGLIKDREMPKVRYFDEERVEVTGN